MPGGSSLHLVSNKREAMAASVTIALTNKTNEVLEARRQWVKGGEAVNLAVSYGPWALFKSRASEERSKIIITNESALPQLAKHISLSDIWMSSSWSTNYPTI